MGRYYSGDIESKFWFGVQNSDSANRFGTLGCEPNYIEYYFDIDSLDDVIKELSFIIETIGQDNLDKLNKEFELINSYNDEILKEYGILEIYNEHKSDYADYLLGIKIRDCIKETGQCNFTAEL